MPLTSKSRRRPWPLPLLLLLLTAVPFAGRAQTDVLELQQNGRNLYSYAPGQPIILETVYDQWFDGFLTALRDDSVFINNIPFHYREIKTLRRERTKLNYRMDGTLLMIAGVGVVALNVINGISRRDKAGQWFSTGGYITAGALLAGGFLLRKAAVKTYPIGKKYQLHYLDLHNDRPGSAGSAEPGNR